VVLFIPEPKLDLFFCVIILIEKPQTTCNTHRVNVSFMSTIDNTTSFVWIKLATIETDEFAFLEMKHSSVLGQVAAQSCTTLGWGGLLPNQIRIYLAAEPGSEEPSLDQINAALLTKHLPINSTISSGSWLIARPTSTTSAASNNLSGISENRRSHSAIEARVAFKSLLLLAGISRPKDEVLERLQATRDSAFLTAATPSEAERWYNWAKLLPLSPTRDFFKGQTGVYLNGEQHPFHRALLLAYDAEGKPLAFKPLSASDDPEAQAAQAALGDDCLAPCTLAQARHSDGQDFVGLLMPKYDHSLADVANHVLPQHVVLSRARGLVGAVNYLHSRGYVHMDIKEANIFVDFNGKWILGDFGSAVKYGEKITSTTRGLHPELLDWLEKGQRAIPSHWQFDWFMLGACLVRRLDPQEKQEEYMDCGPQRSKLLERIARVELEELRFLLEDVLACQEERASIRVGVGAS